MNKVISTLLDIRIKEEELEPSNRSGYAYDENKQRRIDYLYQKLFQAVGEMSPEKFKQEMFSPSSLNRWEREKFFNWGFQLDHCFDAIPALKNNELLVRCVEEAYRKAPDELEEAISKDEYALIRHASRTGNKEALRMICDRKQDIKEMFLSRNCGALSNILSNSGKSQEDLEFSLSVLARLENEGFFADPRSRAGGGLIFKGIIESGSRLVAERVLASYQNAGIGFDQINPDLGRVVADTLKYNHLDLAHFFFDLSLAQGSYDQVVDVIRNNHYSEVMKDANRPTIEFLFGSGIFNDEVLQRIREENSAKIGWGRAVERDDPDTLDFLLNRGLVSVASTNLDLGELACRGKPRVFDWALNRLELDDQAKERFFIHQFRNVLHGGNTQMISRFLEGIEDPEIRKWGILNSMRSCSVNSSIDVMKILLESQPNDERAQEMIHWQDDVAFASAIIRNNLPVIGYLVGLTPRDKRQEMFGALNSPRQPGDGESFQNYVSNVKFPDEVRSLEYLAVIEGFEYFPPNVARLINRNRVREMTEIREKLMHKFSGVQGGDAQKSDLYANLIIADVFDKLHDYQRRVRQTTLDVEMLYGGSFGIQPGDLREIKDITFKFSCPDPEFSKHVPLEYRKLALEVIQDPQFYKVESGLKKAFHEVIRARQEKDLLQPQVEESKEKAAFAPPAPGLELKEAKRLNGSKDPKGHGKQG